MLSVYRVGLKQYFITFPGSDQTMKNWRPGKVLALMTSWADETAWRRSFIPFNPSRPPWFGATFLQPNIPPLGMQLGRELLNEILSSGDGAPVPSAEFVQLLEAAAASKCARSASKCLKLGVSWMGAGQETRRVASPLWCSAPAPSVEPQANFAEKLVKALHGLATCFEASLPSCRAVQ